MVIAKESIVHFPFASSWNKTVKTMQRIKMSFFNNFKNNYYFLAGIAIKCFQCASTEDQRKPTGVWSLDQYTQNRLDFCITILHSKLGL